MSKLYDWATDYIKRYEKMIENAGTGQHQRAVAVGGTQIELYALAKAIVADINGELA